MRLTLYTDYALRLLMYLAVTGENDRATIAEVSASYGIARNHLSKVAHELGVAGFVRGVRGKRGGLCLGRPAATIGLGEVVRRTEPDTALVPCFEPLRAPCPILPACGLRGALLEAQEAFLAVLDRYTLADLVGRRTELRTALQIRPPPPRRARAAVPA